METPMLAPTRTVTPSSEMGSNRVSASSWATTTSSWLEEHDAGAGEFVATQPGHRAPVADLALEPGGHDRAGARRRSGARASR